MPRNVVATLDTVGSASASAAACAHMVMGEMVTAQPVRPPAEERAAGAAAGAAALASDRCCWAVAAAARAARAPARARVRAMVWVWGGNWVCRRAGRRESVSLFCCARRMRIVAREVALAPLSRRHPLGPCIFLVAPSHTHGKRKEGGQGRTRGHARERGVLGAGPRRRRRKHAPVKKKTVEELLVLHCRSPLNLSLFFLSLAPALLSHTSSKGSAASGRYAPTVTLHFYLKTRSPASFYHNCGAFFC